MIAHSGIGTALRGLLAGWREAPPPFRLTVLGPAERLASAAPGFEIVPWEASIYGLEAIVRPAPIGKADVILSMHYTAPMRPLHRPLVAVVHDLIHITHPPRRGTAAYMRARLMLLRARASYVVTASRHTKVQLQTLHGFAPHRVLRIPWGPGIAGLAEPEPLPRDMLPSGPFFLSVGIDKPHKNWDFQLERLARLWREGRISQPLVIAGVNPAGRHRLEALARRLGCADNVRILPHLTDGELVGVYHRAATLLFPSLVEGFGFPLAEALVCSTPLVAADLPPMNEVAPHAMIPFDPDVAESFDRAVIAAATDSALRQDILRHAAATPLPTWKVIARRYEEVLQRAWREKHQ